MIFMKTGSIEKPKLEDFQMTRVVSKGPGRLSFNRGSKQPTLRTGLNLSRQISWIGVALGFS
jgi:hypothetical protein